MQVLSATPRKKTKREVRKVAVIAGGGGGDFFSAN
jgi:hypothetical protein